MLNSVEVATEMRPTLGFSSESLVSPANRLRAMQDVAKQAAEKELEAVVKRLSVLTEDVIELSGIELYTQQQREALSRLASYIHSQLPHLKPPVSESGPIDPA